MAGPIDPPATVNYEGAHGPLLGVFASNENPRGGLLLVHENRGVTAHFIDLVSRFADAGYATLCVDLASSAGGSAQIGDEEKIRAVLGTVPREHLLDDLRSSLDELEQRAPGVELGIIGFCFGGTLTWSLLAAGEARLAAAVAFYGTAAEGADFSGSRAAVLGIYGGLDEKVNATRPFAEAALERSGLTFQTITYDGAEHAFFNDSRPNYNAQAADEARTAVLEWLTQHVG